MTELLARFGAPSDAVRQPTAVEASPRTPALITEQQVLFATAAAVPLQPARPSRRWTESARTFLAAAFIKSGSENQPRRRHYPSRNDIFEDSRMAREMMRL